MNINDSLFDKATRFNMIKNLEKIKIFNGTIWIIGFGGIGTAMIFLLLKTLVMNEENIIVIDKDQLTEKKLRYHYGDKIKFIHAEIKENNYTNILKCVKDDIIVDCAYFINTKDMLEFCQKIGCSYINSSTEDWENDTDDVDPVEDSLIKEQFELQKLNEQFKTKNTNFIITMGCNPGNVSIWAKMALDLINNNKYEYKTFGELAYKLGVSVIHISEKDTQKTNKPKLENEYCNTWSGTAESMYEEGIASAEGTFGTHELDIPKYALNNPSENNNYIILNKRGMSTYLISYTPISKNFIGMMIRHNESYTIGKELSYYVNNICVHVPSVYYVYHPCDSTMISFYELKEKNLEYQDKRRLLTKDIIHGRDELGLTLFFENGDIYWLGSLLSIEEAREIYENKHDDIINATILQVCAGYLAGILHIIELIDKKEYFGLMIPEDLPYKKILKYSLPFLGEFIIRKVNDWDFDKYNHIIKSNKDNKTKWQFNEFLIDI